MQSNVVLRLSLRGKAKSGKMFGSPLAPSPRRRHSHHLKRRDREEGREMGGRRQRTNHCTQLQNSNTSQPGVKRGKKNREEQKWKEKREMFS